MALSQEGVKFSDYVAGLTAGSESDLASGNNAILKTASGMKKLDAFNICKTNEVLNIKESGVVKAYVNTSNKWVASSTTVSRYIKVNKDDVVRIVCGTERTSYYKCLSSIDINQSPVLVKNVVRGTDETFTISSECYLVWLEILGDQNWKPSILTINGIDCIDGLYKENKIETLKKETEKSENATNKNLDKISSSFENMVGTNEINFRNKVDFGTPFTGKYWGSSGLISAENYFAKKDLIEVNPGYFLEFTIATIGSTNPYSITSASAAYGAYDNDLKPVNGGRINFSQREVSKDVNNGDGTTTYFFKIPLGCTKIGLFYKNEPNDFYLSFKKGFGWSENLDNHVKDISSGTQVKSLSDYYLKGSSPKNFEKKICILAAGQSNIDGRCPYSSMPDEIKAAQPISNTHYVKNSLNGSFSQINISGNWAFDLVTYFNLSNRANKEFYVIKWSLGGTSIDYQGDSTSHWTADYEKISSGQTSLLKQFETEIRNHVISNGNDFDIRAVIWHQGEGDRGTIGTGCDDRYYDNLRNMIAYIRGIVGNQKLPFITGTISHSSAQYDEKIETAQKKIAEEDSYYHLVDMSGASLLDSVHFDSVSSKYFGEMCYDLLIDSGIISGSKINPSKPW